MAFCAARTIGKATSATRERKANNCAAAVEEKNSIFYC
jgi:hypothetical protein